MGFEHCLFIPKQPEPNGIAKHFKSVLATEGKDPKWRTRIN